MRKNLSPFFICSAMLAAMSAGSSLTGAPPSASQRTLSRLASDHYAPDIQFALGISDNHFDILPLLENAVKKSRSTDAAAKADALNKLVDGLLAGPDPAVLLDQTVPQWQIGTPDGSPATQPSSKYGTDLQIDSVVNSLWTLAKAAENSNPKRASEMARASIMLSALHDFYDSWMCAAPDVLASPDETKKLLRLTDAEFNKLTAVVQARQDLMVIGDKGDDEAGRRIDAISIAKASVPVADIQAVLSYYDKSFRQGIPQLGYRLMKIQECWTFLSLMKAKRNQEGEDATRRVLESWKHDFPEPDIERWIDQALTRPGRPPGRQVVEYDVGPDGKLRPHVGGPATSQTKSQ